MSKKSDGELKNNPQTPAMSAPRQKHPVIMVGIPAYNEEKSVGTVVTAARKYADRVVVVNDCSADNTVAEAEKAGAEVIPHETNQGYGGSALTLFQTAQKYQPDVLILMDADGQHNPDDIPRFAAKIQEGYDVVIGSRYLKKNSAEMIPLYRKIGMRALDVSTRLSAKSLETTDALCGYRAFNKTAYSSIHHLDLTFHGSTDIIVQLADNGMKFGEISVDVRYDLEGTSTQTPIHMGLELLYGIIHVVVTKRPLLFFGLPGLAALIIGIILCVMALEAVAKTGIWPTTLTVLAAMILMIGMLLTTTALILFAVSEMLKSFSKV